MKYLIVDDEPLAILRLKKMLVDLGIDEIITASNGREALEKVKQYHPSIVLLDIEMPVMRGIEAAPLIKDISPESHIIFCTAYDEFAIKAFDLSVTDYLLKPVKKQRLVQALNKVTVFEDKPSTLTFYHGNDLVCLSISEIYCIISVDKATIMHCQLGEVIIDDSLVSLESKFEQLLRINRNALINVTELFGIHRDKSQAYAKLTNTDYQPQISRRNLSKIKELLK
jgi:two-component system response regulator AlgR